MSKKKVQVGTYLTPEVVEQMQESAANNRRRWSDEVQLALEFYLANSTEPAAQKLLKALQKAGIKEI